MNRGSHGKDFDEIKALIEEMKANTNAEIAAYLPDDEERSNQAIDELATGCRFSMKQDGDSDYLLLSARAPNIAPVEAIDEEGPLSMCSFIEACISVLAATGFLEADHATHLLLEADQRRRAIIADQKQ